MSNYAIFNLIMFGAIGLTLLAMAIAWAVGHYQDSDLYHHRRRMKRIARAKARRAAWGRS